MKNSQSIEKFSILSVNNLFCSINLSKEVDSNDHTQDTLNEITTFERFSYQKV